MPKTFLLRKAMKKSLIALAVLTLLFAGGTLNTLIAGSQEIRHSPNIGLSAREGALAINALLNWLNTSGKSNLSKDLTQAIVLGNTSEMRQDLLRIERLIEGTPALYTLSAEALKGLKAAEGLNTSITPQDLTFLILIAYKQALRNGRLEIAEAFLKVLNGDRLSTDELKNILSMVKMLSNSGQCNYELTLITREVLKALRNGTLLNPNERIEFAAKVAVKHSLLIAILLQAYRPEKLLASLTRNNGGEIKVKESNKTKLTPIDIVNAMYLLEKLGPKTFFILRHFPKQRIIEEIIQPNSTAISILKSIPYGTVVSIEGVEGNYSLSKLKGVIHSAWNNYGEAGASNNSLKIPSKLLDEFQGLTNKIDEVMNSTYLSEGASLEELRKTYLNSSIAARASSGTNAVTDQEILLILAITSLTALASIWLILYQTHSYYIPTTIVEKGSERSVHPFWLVINKYAVKAGIKLKPSLTHREAYRLVTSSARKVLRNSIAGLIKDLMMIYECITYRGDDESLYAHRVNEILRRLKESG